MPQKKETLERFYLEQFIKDSGQKLSIIRKCDPPAPDFEVFEDGIGSCGLEITELVKKRIHKKSSEPKADEIFRNQVIHHAMEHYYANGGIPIRVKVLFRLPPPMAPVKSRWNAKVSEIAQRVLDLVTRSLPSVRGVESQRFDGDESMITSIFIGLVPEDFSSDISRRWECVNNGVGWSRNLALSDLQITVSQKERKVAEYKKYFPRVLLLVYANRSNSSGMYHVVEPALLEIKASNFSNIFLYLYPKTSFQIYPEKPYMLGKN